MSWAEAVEGWLEPGWATEGGAVEFQTTLPTRRREHTWFVTELTLLLTPVIITAMLPMLAGLVLAVWPSNLTVATGGMSVESRTITSGCWHDPKAGYFLYKSMECDGAHRHIALTKDRRMVTDFGYEVARFRRKPAFTAPGKGIEERSLVLATKHGISIGMDRDEVVRMLGTPARTATRGNNKEFWCALYKKIEMEDQENGQVLRNTYIFKNGKLIEIIIDLDSIPGCGDHDGKADKGWPWSKF